MCSQCNKTHEVKDCPYADLEREARCERCGDPALEDYHLCYECRLDAIEYQREHDAYYYN